MIRDGSSTSLKQRPKYTKEQGLQGGSEKRHVAEGESPQKEQGLRTTTSCNTLPWIVREGLRQCVGLRSDSWGRIRACGLW